MTTPVGLTPGTRWRCDACGNLTRFDVETTERVRRFWHLDLAGQGRVEEEQVSEVQLHAVVCRWCGSRDAVQVVDVPHGSVAGEGPVSPSA
ncbi:MAG TPA: hypothetical protein VM307_13590 [Egibacteraceae bacterium]|nr:hypothetical protein [Egibacteraceae bacterium]